MRKSNELYQGEPYQQENCKLDNKINHSNYILVNISLIDYNVDRSRSIEKKRKVIKK